MLSSWGWPQPQEKDRKRYHSTAASGRHETIFTGDLRLCGETKRNAALVVELLRGVQVQRVAWNAAAKAFFGNVLQLIVGPRKRHSKENRSIPPHKHIFRLRLQRWHGTAASPRGRLWRRRRLRRRIVISRFRGSILCVIRLIIRSLFLFGRQVRVVRIRNVNAAAKERQDEPIRAVGAPKIRVRSKKMRVVESQARRRKTASVVEPAVIESRVVRKRGRAMRGAYR